MNSSKLIVTFFLFIVIKAQELDSLKTILDSLTTKSVIDSVASFPRKTYRYKLKAYQFELFNTNRPKFFVATGFYPNSSHVILDGFRQKNIFSDGYNMRSLPDERVFYYQLNGNKLTALGHQINFLIPFTKLNIIDGDFGFTDVNVVYMQRFTEHIAVKLNINNTSADGGFGNALYNSPGIDGQIFYDFDKKTSLIISYGFRRERFVDYGYTLNNDIALQQEYSHIDITKQLTAIYNYNDLQIRYQYQQQKRNGYFDDTKIYFEQDAELHNTKFVKNLTQNMSISLNYSTQHTKGSVYLNTPNLNQLSFESNYHLNDSNWVKFEYGLLLGEYIDIAELSSPFSLDFKTNLFGFMFFTSISSRLPSVNELFYSKVSDDIVNPIFNDQLSAINPNFKLMNEDNYYGSLSKEIINGMELTISANYYINKIGFSSSVNQYINKHDVYHSTISITTKSTLFDFFQFGSLLNYNYQRNNSYLPDIQALMSISKEFRLFSSLDVELELYWRYFGQRTALDYNKYTDLFTLNPHIKYPSIFVPSFKLRFTIKTVDVILELENPFNQDYPVVHGYEPLASRVLFGIKWGFIN